MDDKLHFFHVVVIFIILEETSLEFQSLRASGVKGYEGIERDSNSNRPLGHFEALMSDLLSGPLRGGTLVVYLDDAIPRDVQQAIMALDAVQETPHVTLSLGVNETWWPDQQVPAFIHGSSVLHLVLFLTHPTKFLQSLWLNWKPRNLLLFSLAPSSDAASILNHDAFNGVQKLALITELPDEVHGRPHTMGVYTLQPFSSSEPKFLGEWKPHHHSRRDDLFPDRFPSFEGYRFELATNLIDPPFLYRRRRNASDGAAGARATTASGVTVKMLDALSSSALNFTYTMTADAPDSEWGALRDGNWSGLLGMVHRTEKNFSVSNLFRNLDRFRDFDASAPTWEDGFGFVMPDARPLPEWLNVHRPFSPLVWAAVAATFVVAVCLLTLQERVCGRPFLGGVVATWLYLQRGVFSQGVPVLPRALRQRMFLGVWYLYCLIVSAYYTSNLIAIFTSPADPQRIHTLQELADSDYRVAMKDDGNSLPPVLRASKDRVYRRLSQKLDLYQREAEAVAAMEAGTHVFVQVSVYVHVRLRIHYQLFDWYIVKERFLYSQMSWMFPKHTPWKFKFDQGIRRMRETGLVQHWFKAEMESLLGWDWKLRQQEASAGQRSNMVLSLQHLQGVFYILVFAWAASVAVFLLELLRHRCSRQ